MHHGDPGGTNLQGNNRTQLALSTTVSESTLNTMSCNTMSMIVSAYVRCTGNVHRQCYRDCREAKVEAMYEITL
jgi:hypothetical protein